MRAHIGIVGRCMMICVVLRAEAVHAQSRCAEVVQQLTTVTVPGRSESIPRPTEEISHTLEQALAQPPSLPEADPGKWACTVGELMRHLGDTRAASYYRQATFEAPTNAEYHLLFGDYLRGYRGPEEPLVGAAAREYFAGLKTADTAARNEIRRSLLALYERDGISLTRALDTSTPFLFFSTQNAASHALNDAGVVDDLRTLTSEALLTASRIAVPGQPVGLLDTSLAAGLLLNAGRFQTLNRLRVRYNSAAVDVYRLDKANHDAQVTTFTAAEGVNSVRVGLNGVGVEEVLSLYPLFDVMIRGDVQWGSESGLIEGAPDASQSVTTQLAHATLSRFVGANKLNIELVADHDSLHEHVQTPIARARDLMGITGRYQIFAPLWGSRPFERPIAPRESEFFAGWTGSVEQFGGISVAHNDYFAGVAFKGMPGGGNRTLDVTFQPTVFTSTQAGAIATNIPSGPLLVAAPTLNNRQVEPVITALYRFVDHENERNIDRLPTLLALNVVTIGSYGRATDGPAYFDRWRLGTAVNAKVVGRQRGGVTWLLSAAYEWQRFNNLDLLEHLLSVSIDLGF